MWPRLLTAYALCIFCLFPTDGEGARILGVFLPPVKSHLLIHCAVAETLAQAGHNVTVIGALPNVYPNAKYNYIQIEVTGLGQGFMNQMVQQKEHIYQRLLHGLPFIIRLANETLSSPTMQQFLHTHGAGEFDLLIVASFFNDFHLGLAAHFDCPVIVSLMIQPFAGLNSLIGNPTEVSYVPLLFTGLKQPMNFWARLENFIAGLYEDIVLDGINSYHVNKYYNYHFPADRYPPLSDVKKNVSLLFSNHHFISQGPIRPNVPALIDIGGIQIKEKPDPLPADIKQVLDSVQRGVIYFSLGTNIQGKNLHADKIQVMFDVLSKLPYNVLWKWSDDFLPGTADNIIYKSWLPQDDILAHPNTKLFITHGGQGSVVESKYHGVPMVGIPFFADQHSNIASMAEIGCGRGLDYHSLTVEDFREAIVDVIENPKYAKAVKNFSKLYRDRPMTPRELVVYWVDYVLRHRGAKHLQSPAVHLNRLQLHSWDVFAFIWAVLVAVVGSFVWTCRVLCCRGRRQSKLKKKTN